jgi:hypothetical protein
VQEILAACCCCCHKFDIFLSSFENPFEQNGLDNGGTFEVQNPKFPGWNNDEQDEDRLKNYVSFFVFCFWIPAVFLKLPIGPITCSLLTFTCQVG